MASRVRSMFLHLSLLSFSPSLLPSLNAQLWPRCCSNALCVTTYPTAGVFPTPTPLSTSEGQWASFPPWTRDHQAATFTYATRGPSSPGPGSLPLWSPEVRRREGRSSFSLISSCQSSPGNIIALSSILPRPPHPAPHTCIYQWPAWVLAKYLQAQHLPQSKDFWSLVRFPLTSTACHLTNYYLLQVSCHYWSCL